MPALVILATGLLAVGLVELDLRFDSDMRRRWPRLFSIESEGARSILSAIAGSMATVAGVVFSITIVALALAASQYTSRVLRNFMRDPINQVMLGIFVGVYIYCLLILRTIRGGSDTDGAFVPSIAVLGALALAVFACGFFIFFIHHISSSIQASEMIAAITRETLETIDAMSDERPAPGAPPHAAMEDGKWQPVAAQEMGYVQSIDDDALLAIAAELDTTLRIECATGDYVWPGRSLVLVQEGRPPDQRVVDAVNHAFAIGSYRTIEQDPGFGFRQLVDIALKALSPGINDTTTAVTCIEHLSVLLARCARRPIAAGHRSAGRRARLIARQPGFAGLASLAFDQILENARGNTEILLRLLAAIRAVREAAQDRETLDVLACHVDAIEEAGKLAPRTPHVTARLDAAVADARRRLLDAGNGRTA